MNPLQSPSPQTGTPLPSWTPPPRPTARTLNGRYCRLEPLNAALHAPPLHQALSTDITGALWTFLPYGPFTDLPAFQKHLEQMAANPDLIPHVLVDLKSDLPVGIAAYLRIDPPNGSIEVGHILYVPGAQRTTPATEAMALLMEQAFSLGYRRYEWKCNALNIPSRRAAQRLGFSYEGLFRQAAVVKGCNRDTAWYSVIDPEWPTLQQVFRTWLAPENFFPDGTQRRRLSDLTAPLLKARG